jgi:hypothetical protein
MHGSKSPLADADVDPPWHARIVGSGDRDRDRHHLRIHCAGAAARLWISALPAATRLRGIAHRRYRAFAGVDVALASASGLVSGTDGASVDIHLLGASRASDQWLRALSFSRRRRAALLARRVSKRMPFRAQRGACFLKDERISRGEPIVALPTTCFRWILRANRRSLSPGWNASEPFAMLGRS